ncbi:hypothetical protein AGDE_07494 [Angomonas deanei]|uniref:Uncharacterized protein n=1 Tax=Angomonas deanei TaxID=59799 RepID=A0A7G2C6X5_9TRYP|nr:hypothetical protein AGDE_07494 [Angomonas deanei]CAD2215225.1 hypothetical protein, conserved [Angomonas deanei]|eukprot:EPY35287.1 hypothetical protein AGDE_07494 [Angomonas deanei]
MLREEQHHKLPLTYAVEQNLPESILQLLLAAGASVSKCESGSKNRYNALLQTCWTEEDGTWRLLLQHSRQQGQLLADLTVADPQGRTPLHVLASSTSHRAVEMLEQIGNAGEDTATDVWGALLSCQDKEGATPLHTALRQLAPAGDYLLDRLAEQPQEALVKVLTTQTSKSGETPLLYLFSSHVGGKEVEPKIRAVGQRLLSLHPPQATHLNKQNVSLLSLLTAQPHVFTTEEPYAQLLRHLWEHHKDEFDRLMGAKDTANGFSFIHHIILYKNTPAMKALVQFLADQNMDPTEKEWLTATAGENVSCTELAATRGDFPDTLLQLLLTAGIVKKEEYTEIHAQHEQLQQERQEEEEAEEDEETDEEEAVVYQPHYKEKKQGPNRAQQSRRVWRQKAARDLRAKRAEEEAEEENGEGRAIKDQPRTEKKAIEPRRTAENAPRGARQEVRHPAPHKAAHTASSSRWMRNFWSPRRSIF